MSAVQVSMPELTRSPDLEGGGAFQQALKRAIESLPAGSLPLSAGLAQGGRVDDTRVSATVLSVTDLGDHVLARVGVFFTEVVGGCSCGDDLMEVNAYCELQVGLDKRTAQVEFRPLGT